MAASEYANPWTYDGKILRSEDIGDSYGFVYIITDLVTGKKYVGKKLFWNKKTRQVKGKKKRTVVESDWMTYYGSSLELLVEIERAGRDNFRREILHLCKSKGECNYWEAYEQFTRNVLLSDDYYNGHIWVRVHRTHLKNVKVHKSHVKNLTMEMMNVKEEGTTGRIREPSLLGFEELGKERVAWPAEGDASGLHGGPVQADGKPAEGDRKKEKGRARRAQP